MNVNLAVFHDVLRALKSINPLVGIDMIAKFKKFFLALMTVALGAMSSGAMAESATQVTVGGQLYDFSTVTNVYPSQTSTFQAQPYWENSALALTFGNALYSKSAYGNIWYGIDNDNVWLPNVGMKTVSIDAGYPPEYPGGAFLGGTGNSLFASSETYYLFTPSSAAVPEIDGALIPQVGLLLAGLFIILGRRKERTEPMLAV